MRTKANICLLSIVFTVFLLCGVASAVSLPERGLDYDLVIAGAGAGGTMAAVQAARMGARVALVEESGWIGGQMTGAGVSTMDDVRRNRSGIYGEFLERVRAYYARTDTPVNTCYWGSDTVAFEPKAGQEILYAMLEEAGEAEVYLRCRLKEAVMSGDVLREIVVEQGLERLRFRAPVFIDATECGDLLPLTPARYRAGNSISPSIREDANIQDITWVGVIRKNPEGAQGALRVAEPPACYAEDLPRFEHNVSLQGNRWPRGYPVDIPSFNAYRGLPDPSNPQNIDCGKPHTWERITKTSLNWANDYPGRGGYERGLSVRYLEDPHWREEINARALLRTLGFLYYYQQEMGQPWTVDETQHYDFGAPVGDLRISDCIPESFHGITRYFPPFPYVRESRRLVGCATLTVRDLKRNKATGRTCVNFPSSIALGEYPVDIHGSHLDEYMEHDLGESIADFPPGWVPSKGVFQVPLGCLIPERVEGLLAAEKNISVSRLVNGATRLQPITMLTGQAAGALGALAARGGVPPREVPLLAVQAALWKGGSRLSLYSYRDVPRSHPLWEAVQDATLHGYCSGLSRSYFGLTLPVTEQHAVTMINRALGSALVAEHPRGFLSGEDFAGLLEAAGALSVRENVLSSRDISRGEAVELLHAERLRREP